MNIQKAIISPPFSMYLPIRKATPIRGSYTADARPGRYWGALTRFGYTSEGWVNAMGLRNPGIDSQKFDKHQNAIWSLAGFNHMDFLRVICKTPSDAVVELNFSCPNIKAEIWPGEMKDILRCAVERFAGVIVKLPADHMRACSLYTIAANEGVTAFHACNTVKTSRGGLSGREIQKYSLPLIRMMYIEGVKTIIGGGGIYAPDDVKRYRDYGATNFSLGTICMTPWKIPAVMREIYRG